MKDVAPHDRPREKLERLGPAALGDNELVALVLGSGSRQGGALDLANRLLAQLGGLRALPRAGTTDLRAVRGVGRARAAQVIAAIELGRRTLLRHAAERPQLVTAVQTAAYLLPRYGSNPVEQFGVILLDTKYRVLTLRIVSVGSLDATVVHPREVFREATVAGAAAVVLFHNHPSGDPTPSPDDLALTERLVRAGKILGIAVVDHLILSDQHYVSMMQSGRAAELGLSPEHMVRRLPAIEEDR
jgi:DNA repair protein RadC